MTFDLRPSTHPLPLPFPFPSSLDMSVCSPFLGLELNKKLKFSRKFSCPSLFNIRIICLEFWLTCSQSKHEFSRRPFADFALILLIPTLMSCINSFVWCILCLYVECTNLGNTSLYYQWRQSNHINNTHGTLKRDDINYQCLFWKMVSIHSCAFQQKWQKSCCSFHYPKIFLGPLSSFNVIILNLFHLQCMPFISAPSIYITARDHSFPIRILLSDMCKLSLHF